MATLTDEQIEERALAIIRIADAPNKTQMSRIFKVAREKFDEGVEERKQQAHIKRTVTMMMDALED